MGGDNVAVHEIIKAKPLPYRPGDIIPGTQQRVVRVIGRGGFSTVYLTMDVKLKRLHATKVLDFSRFDSSGDDYRKLFELEMQATALVEHENVCRIFAAGETADDLAAPYCVMEYLQGADLHSIIGIYRNKKKKFSVEAVLKLGIGIFDGLNALHEKGIIHRDLKPANIFYQALDGNDSRPKLLDLGTHSLSGYVERNLLGERVYRGTFRYSAPEQWLGEPPYAQTDLYAAGIVLYEVLTGATPFHRFPHDDHRSLRKAHLTETPRPIRDIDPDVPEALAALVESLLHKDYRRRGYVGEPDEKKLVTAARVVQQLRSLLNQLNQDSTTSQVLTSPNVAIPLEDDPSEEGAKPHPLQRPTLTDIAPTEHDLPEWLERERRRRGEPADGDLGPEPEAFVPVTDADWEIFRQLTKQSPEERSLDASVDNSVPTQDLRPDVTRTGPAINVPDAVSADSSSEPRRIPTRTIPIEEVPPAPAPREPLVDATNYSAHESSAPASNTADVEVPPSASFAVTQGPLPASPDDSSSLNRYVESPLEINDPVAVPPAKIAAVAKKPVEPRPRRTRGLWRALTDTWGGLIFLCVAVGVSVTATIIRNPDLFGDRSGEATPVTTAPTATEHQYVALPSNSASSKTDSVETSTPALDGSTAAANAPSMASASAQPPSASSVRSAPPKAKPAGPLKPTWLDTRK